MAQDTNSTARNVTSMDADPRQTLLAMQRDLTTINDAIGGLSALAMLIDGYQDDTVDVRQVVRLLDPVVSNLRNAAEEMEMSLRRTRGAMGGDRPLPGENDLRLCQLAEEHRRLEDWAPDLKHCSDRQEAIATEMLDLPADSLIGAAAKLVAARAIGEGEPTDLYPKVQHRALDEIERLAGFGSQQQAAE